MTNKLITTTKELSSEFYEFYIGGLINLTKTFNTSTNNPSAPKLNLDEWNTEGFSNIQIQQVRNIITKKYPEITNLYDIRFLDDSETWIRAISNEIHAYNHDDLSKIFTTNKENIKDIQSILNNFFYEIQPSTNCYQHALNDKTIHQAYISATPAGIFPDNSFSKIIQYCISDGCIDAGDKLPPILKDHYRIALFIRKDNCDYHFIRENQTKLGTIWSHKLGQKKATSKDSINRIITAPKTANIEGYEIINYFHIPKEGLKTKPMPAQQIRIN